MGLAYRRPWNQCQICGRLIAYQAFSEGQAVHTLLVPSNEFGDETWDTYHVACEKKEADRASVSS